MSKYTKVDDIKNVLIELSKSGKWLERGTTINIIKALGNLPTIDIVHCKECKHGEYREDFDDYLCDQLGLGLVNDADFFCSDGERKDNE